MLRQTLHNMWAAKWKLRYLFRSIYLNLHYLPFTQAVRLPILVYKPCFKCLAGKIVIDTPDGTVRRGMIRLGRHLVPVYDSHGIMIENRGTIIFHGDCELGSGTKLSVAEGGVLEFGDKSRASAESKFICQLHIKIGEDVGIGWGTMIMDTDMHRLTTVDGTEAPDPVAPITIGDQTWIASECRIQKGTSLPSRCVVASGSLLNKRYDIEPYSLLAGRPARVLRTGIWRDRTNEDI